MLQNKAKFKTRNIPRLRFSEFVVAWEEKRLGELSRIYDGTHQTPEYVKEGIPFYSVEHLTANDFSNTKYIAKEIFEKENKRVRLERNDILMTRIGDIGTARLIDWDVQASYYVSLALIKHSEKINSHFLSQYINSVGFQKELWKRTIHVAFPKKINLGEISECKLSVSSLPEQQKISTFLGAVDDWIGNLRLQKKNLEVYKKGMMQKIFLQEVRFKDDKGKEFAKWEEKKLGAVGKIYNGLSGKTGEDFGQGDPYIAYKQIFDSSKIDVSKFALVEIKKDEKQNRAQFGDIFFTTSSETPHEVGFASVLLNKDVDPYLNSFSFGLRANSLKELDPYFARFLFRSSIYRKQVIKLAQGSTRYNISKVEFSKIKLLFPFFPEQQKIAEFLTSLNSLIESKQQQITQAETWKKGLMQGLFV